MSKWVVEHTVSVAGVLQPTLVYMKILLGILPVYHFIGARHHVGDAVDVFEPRTTGRKRLRLHSMTQRRTREVSLQCTILGTAEQDRRARRWVLEFYEQWPELQI
ncbi:hypothetical protein CCYA_CCYA18G4568 [Cyanidiococcus yangmingshanensis]|nr:hypothetical protein CCYA_CCYA18G4568 [Cyanidiococcus yangmingshanensis]